MEAIASTVKSWGGDAHKRVIHEEFLQLVELIGRFLHLGIPFDLNACRHFAHFVQYKNRCVVVQVTKFALLQPHNLAKNRQNDF